MNVNTQCGKDFCDGFSSDIYARWARRRIADYKSATAEFSQAEFEILKSQIVMSSWNKLWQAQYRKFGLNYFYLRSQFVTLKKDIQL